MNLQNHAYSDPFGEDTDVTRGDATSSISPSLEVPERRGNPILPLAELDVQVVSPTKSDTKFTIISTFRDGSVVRADRTLSQLLACRIQMADLLPFHVIPTLPSDLLASATEGREHVLAFAHFIATSSATRGLTVVRMLMGYEGTVDEVEQTFKLRISSLLKLDRQRQKPLQLSKLCSKVEQISERAVDSNISEIGFRLLDLLTHAGSAANFFHRRQVAAAEASSAWRAVVVSATAVRVAAAHLATSMQNVVEPLSAVSEHMFWPWTKHSVIHTAALDASKAAVSRHAAKIRGGRAKNAEAITPSAVPQLEHPTIRLRRYFQRVANLCEYLSTTASFSLIVTPMMARAMTLAMIERASESSSAILAQSVLHGEARINALEGNARIVRSALTETPVDIQACENRLREIESETMKTIGFLNGAVSTLEVHAADLRTGVKRMLHDSLAEATQTQHCFVMAAQLIVDDLLAIMNADLFVDDEDTPFSFSSSTMPEEGLVSPSPSRKRSHTMAPVVSTRDALFGTTSSEPRHRTRSADQPKNHSSAEATPPTARGARRAAARRVGFTADPFEVTPQPVDDREMSDVVFMADSAAPLFFPGRDASPRLWRDTDEFGCD
jgi:hypothetical protein